MIDWLIYCAYFSKQPTCPARRWTVRFNSLMRTSHTCSRLWLWTDSMCRGICRTLRFTHSILHYI